MKPTAAPTPHDSAADGPPTVALVLVVRDEERFLADNLRHHRALGVSRFYIYLDRCADRSPEMARACEAAEVIERDRRPEEAFMSQYQTAVLADALGRARRDGFDWLLHVDADEFAWGENDAGLFARKVTDATPCPAARGSLPALVRRAATRLRGRGRRVDQIILRTVENVPTPLADGRDVRRSCGGSRTTASCRATCWTRPTRHGAAARRLAGRAAGQEPRPRRRRRGPGQRARLEARRRPVRS